MNYELSYCMCMHAVILIGDVGVGKSSLFRRFKGDEFQDGYCDPMEGFESTNREIQVYGDTVKVEIWDYCMCVIIRLGV